MPLSGWPMYNCKALATFKSMVVVISDLENLANLGLVSGRGQRIKEDKLFKRENLVNFSLQTSINVFFLEVNVLKRRTASIFVSKHT